MKRGFRWMGTAVCAAGLLLIALVEGRSFQRGGTPPPTAGSQGEEQDTKLPSGKSQRDEILRQEREDNIKDAAQLAQLAQELKEDLEKNDRFVLSLTTLKKTDDIEKLARKIRGRMRHN
jgi:hypothetical protein